MNKSKRIKECIEFLTENGYVVHTREDLEAAFSNLRNGKQIVQDDNGQVIGLQG